MQFFGYFFQKNCTNEINNPKFAKGKYLWNVLKNRSNEIRTNEIRIMPESSVQFFTVFQSMICSESSRRPAMQCIVF